MAITFPDTGKPLSFKNFKKIAVLQEQSSILHALMHSVLPRFITVYNDTPSVIELFEGELLCGLHELRTLALHYREDIQMHDQRIRTDTHPALQAYLFERQKSFSNDLSHVEATYSARINSMDWYLVSPFIAPLLIAEKQLLIENAQSFFWGVKSGFEAILKKLYLRHSAAGTYRANSQ